MHINLNGAWVTPAKVGVAGLAIGGGLGYLVARRRFDRDLETALMFKDVLAQAFPDTDPEQIALEFNRMIEKSKTTEIKIVGPDDFLDDSPRSVVVKDSYEDQWRKPTPEEHEAVFGPEPFESVNVIKDVPTGDNRPKFHIEDLGSVPPPMPDIPDTDKMTGPFFQEPETPQPQTRNVFHDDWDMAEQSEIRARGEGPYTLHINEYHNRELGYPQQTLTWWASDEILSDENDVRVYDVNGVIGEPQWGVGSGDPDIVYIRNEKRHGEYEVIRKHGSYQNHIYGVQAEEDADDQDLKHSARIRRFRQE